MDKIRIAAADDSRHKRRTQARGDSWRPFVAHTPRMSGPNSAALDPRSGSTSYVFADGDHEKGPP